MSQEINRLGKVPEEFAHEERLDSWKQIAAHLKCSERTARRWEQEGLPVHRHPHQKKPAIYAYKAEVDEWWRHGHERLKQIEDDLREAGAVPPSAATVSFPRQPWPRAGLALVIATVVVAALIASRSRERVLGRTLTPPIRSIAVLPLENLSHDPEQEYFADGMTDALITGLAKIHALRVISRNSIMLYKSKSKSTPDIARELNVDALVEGTVMRSGDRVRITAQLIEARKDRHLWADTYEGELRDVLSLQDRVAKAIAAEVKVNLSPKEHALLADAHTVNPEAQEAYLRGLYFWNTNRNQRDISKAIELFQQAIEKDPSNAPAYAGLADAYASLVGWEVLPPLEALPKAKAAAARALQNDGSLAEAHGSLGHADMYDWDFTGAENEFKQAIQLNPSYATGHWFYALDLSKMGKLDEAVAETYRAHNLDPVSRLSNEVSGWIFYLARRYDDAIEQEQKALEMDPNLAPARFYLGLAYEQELKYPEAIQELKRAVALSGNPEFAGALGHAYGVSGQRAEAKKILKQLDEQSRHLYVSSFSVALVHLGLGEKERTFEWLDQAFRERAQFLTNLKVDPRFDNLRSDPRLIDLLRRIGLFPMLPDSHERPPQSSGIMSRKVPASEMPALFGTRLGGKICPAQTQAGRGQREWMSCSGGLASSCACEVRG